MTEPLGAAAQTVGTSAQEHEPREATVTELRQHGPTETVSEAIHAEKYRLKGESFREAMCRVADALKDDTDHYRSLRNVLLDMRFLPAGRVQSAMGSPRQVTAFNCYVSGTIEDSFVDGEGSIMDRAKEAAATMRMGGGIGYDFSTLRPRGALIGKLESRSSGPVSFMEIYDAICRCVASSGHRRGAQMGVLRVDHPDIEEFIHAKQNQSSLTGFNISVAVTDEFMQCVRDNLPFMLRWGGQDYQEVNARHLWDMIMRSTWDWAEPGVVFIDRINTENNLWYCEKIVATNPCVPADTGILTQEGWRPIGSLVGRMVRVWNGEQWSLVEPRLTGKSQPLVRVTLSDGQSLVCTPSHKFILTDDTRVEASELLVGEELMTCEWPVVDSGEDHEEAYTQGLFAGDGWLASNKRPYLSFKREDKKSLLPHILHENSYTTKQDYLFIYLKDHVTPVKDFVPGCDWSVKSRLDWLAGLLDSDGTVSWNYDRDDSRSSCSLQVSSVNKEFLDDVVLMLNTLGVRTSRDIDKRSRDIQVSDCHRIGINSGNVKKLTDLGLRCRRVDVCDNNPAWSKSLKLRVMSVEKLNRAEDVYCFTEKHRHAGCFNGVFSAQCGEQPLPAHGACLLGSFNLVKYLRCDTSGESCGNHGLWRIDFDLLRSDIPHVVRAMDNVVDRTLYPLPEQKHEAVAKRRMGLGVTGLANALEAMGLPYGSSEFVRMQEELMEKIANWVYQASAELAAEKGSFPLYDPELYLRSAFVSRLWPETQDMIRDNGIRNSHLLSVAPTGTISLAADNVSSGIEPVFSYKTERLINMPDGQEAHEVTDYGRRVLGVEGRRTEDVTIQQHLDVLVTAQRWVDSAVSKTCNVPGDVSWEEFKQVYMDAWRRGAKGCTTFRIDGRRFGVLKSADEKEPAACYIDPVTGKRECE